MSITTRSRFILLATSSYCVLALAWIFLSDQLLAAFVDTSSMVWLSTAKGVFFVLATALMFFFALRAVPTADSGFLGAFAQGITPGKRPHWLIYSFAVVITLAMLVVRQHLAASFGERPLLILFMLPITLSALLGGLGPGLLATAVAALGVAVLVFAPLYNWRIASSQDQFLWAFLLINGLAVSLLSELLRQSLAKQEASRQLLDSMVAGTSDAIFAKDRHGRYLLINEAAAQIIGRPVNEILGRDDSFLFPPASAQTVMTQDRRVMDQGHTQTVEEEIVTLGGEALVFLSTKGPLFDQTGQATGLFGISRDISERKRAEAAQQEREQQLARVLEGSDQGYWDWNLASNSFLVSARGEEMLGYEPGELNASGQHWLEHVHPDDRDSVLASIKQHLAGEAPSHQVEMRCRTKNGEWRWILTRGRVVERAPDGQPLMMAGTHTDISERKHLELSQREANTVFQNSYEGIVVVGPDKRITKVNPAFTRITGYTQEEAAGQTPKLLASGLHGAAFYREMWDSVSRQDFWRGEIWNRRKNGEVYAELLSISVVRDTQGVIQHYIGAFSDISQIKAHEAELDRIAHYDPLTGSPNRRLLADRLAQAIIRAARNDKSLAVCFLDLDGFKAINDRHGHAAGDQLLLGVTANLKQVLRGEDTLARLGGDEFVVLLSDISSPEECSLILDRVLKAVSNPVQLEHALVSVSASIGVSLYPEDNADADTLLRHADQAMYLAKESGKNRFHLFDPESDRKAQLHRHYLERLRIALERNEFVLHYQPKVDLINGAVIGAEALIRWQQPENGLVPPAEFLPHVYRGDLETPLGEWVIETALAQASAWHRDGLRLTVSVNVSANHLLQPDFHEKLKTSLARHPGFPAAHFELEVLETAAIADMEQAVAVLQRCRELGVHFALDDFGTGYSSLTYLRKLPVDILKIDQSFVRDMLTDPDDLGIVEGVIRLASAFNRQVIAEGVETLEHGIALRRLGCRFAQGYGIAKPMPAEQMVDWVADWNQAPRL